MVRTQVQLTEEQAAKLKQLSERRQRSMADLLRESLDRLLAEADDETRKERMRRATRTFGKFRSGAGDLARRHDDHFATAVARR
jgi:Arc/MetJ-type ribon-helix-helix transcriptional regulator